MTRPKWWLISGLLVSYLFAGCESVPLTQETAFNGFKPRSILVLPPTDNTFEVAASYAYLPTVTRPIAERGYYVFPVAVVDRIMRENGLTDPAQMHQVSLTKIKQVFDADAVLYLNLTDWGSTYRVLESRTQVTITGRMIDVGTGQLLWQGEASANESSDTGEHKKLGDLLLSALFRQVAASIADNSQEVARAANESLFETDDNRFAPGPYFPVSTR